MVLVLVHGIGNKFARQTINRHACIDVSPSLMSNDVRRTRMKRDLGYFARKRGRFAEIQAKQTGTFERKRGKEREEKSVSCLPVSLESELYFVIISALSRSLLAFPLISFSTKAETETLRKKHVPRACRDARKSF